ncbi:hypothetical protein V6N13_049106 [Hibiscus sabdariffa]|uniref:Uncharacterized protein n=1 Tax=Hibiscus sabdariffa TaxID=183260 RepID=A0ABR2QYX8_9ROSI
MAHIHFDVSYVDFGSLYEECSNVDFDITNPDGPSWDKFCLQKISVVIPYIRELDTPLSIDETFGGEDEVVEEEADDESGHM